ncbi:MAG: glycosyltransferase [Euryarchaeota archaeon]|nr:glycosyltransferase [Euryarchaeota archaeon]
MDKKPVRLTLCIFSDIYSIHTQRWCDYFASKGHIIHLFFFTTGFKSPVITKSVFPGAYVYPNNIILHDIHTLNFYWEKCRKKLFRKIITALDILFTFVKITYLVHRIKPDIVHGHYLRKFGYWACKVNRHPLILSAWGGDIASTIIGSKQHKEYIEMFKKADLVHTGDIPGRDRLIELGCPTSKIFIQIWGVETDFFNPSQCSEELRMEICKNPNRIIITSANALKKAYDTETLLKAFAKIISKHDYITLLIIGDGPEKDNLIRLSESLGMKNRVIFIGHLAHQDIPKYFASSDIYVDPMPIQVGGGGIGVSLLEAMSCGVSIVAANRPGALLLAVENKYNGYTFRPSDPNDLAEKITFLLNKKDERLLFGMRCRERALEIGNWYKNMEDFTVKYNELIRKYS